MLLYKSFLEKFSHIQLLRQVQRLLEWDQQTFMPCGAIEIRAKQLAYIAGFMHKEATSSAYRYALEEMVDIETGRAKIEGLTLVQEANLREWSRDFRRMAKLPEYFIKEYYTVIATATEVWKKARQASDFSLFSPWLQKVVDLNQQQADLLGYADSPYDALIDLYEPGIVSATLSPIFDDLASFLSPFVKEFDENNNLDRGCFNDSFPQEDQMKFNYLLLETIGIGRENARLDCSAHPFCMGIHPSDVRLTTHLNSGLLENIFAVLHEGGHALYEQGLPKEEWATPSGQFASMGLHESQSKWWEIMVGKSLPFWTYMYPKFQAQFPQFKALDLSDFYQHINHVRPSCIRIYADEVTYPLHVILRFELEKQLIEGSIMVADVPSIWNNKMKELLGVTPKNDAEGCLQDIHWSSGAFGYFPTYALGSIYAAQYFGAFIKSFPDWEAKVAVGSFSFMNNWLREHIHQFGRMYNAAQSIKRVTGYPISAQPYKDYITKKYKGHSA